MPPIRSVTILSTGATIISAGRTRTFRYQTVPSTLTTLASVETFANAWASTAILDCQVRMHVFQLTPLSLTVGTFDLGDLIPANWWADA